MRSYGSQKHTPTEFFLLTMLRLNSTKKAKRRGEKNENCFCIDKMKIKMRYVKWIWWGELKEKKKQVVYSFYQQAADQGQLVEGRTGEKTHTRERERKENG